MRVFLDPAGNRSSRVWIFYTFCCRILL